ncbi:hypothetical protein [Pseudomonas chlororaphis]|uniref:hypothetical protein n=1 Tax=Pseudomonas chlororaphis TaxID=587753 RepID=UPI000F577BC3|nr:hypothetical protein [Pseudomonas chlororaphis]
MLAALMLGMVPEGKIRNYILRRIIKCTNFFVGLGLSSLAFCITYYAKFGWAVGLSTTSIGGVVYWLGINHAFFQSSNVEIFKRGKIALLMFSFLF